MKKFLLVGNANTGKTTLLNTLTKSCEHTGNWHGVTVEEKEKFFTFQSENFCVVDLPGIYSLNAFSFEEQVSIDYIFKNQYDVIVNTCDVNTLKKNLFLTLDLILAGKTNIVLAVNTMGKQTNKIDVDRIKSTLGVDVLLMDFANKKDVDKLKKYIKKYNKKNILKINYFEKIFSKNFNSNLIFLESKFNIDKFEIIKIIEKNNFFVKKFNKNNYFLNYLNNFSKINLDLIIKEKYLFINKLLNIKQKSKIYGNDFLDKIFLNKFLAVPIFLLIMLGIFYLTFFSVGAFLRDVLSSFVQVKLSSVVCGWLESVCSVLWVIGLVEDGLFAGVGSLVSFLPQVVLLFLFLSIMEETGYFARIAFIFEDLLSSIGLSGKSVYTLLMGFGCNASAVITTRALDNKHAKIKTALITPYMSCSAKLPVFAVFGGAFFGAGNVWIIFLLYLIGVFTALLVNIVLDKFFLKSPESSFIMEFPPYRLPKLKKIGRLTYQNMKMFLVKVTTIFISMNVIVWCLGSFDFSFHYIAGGTNGKSMLESLGSFFAPVFAPLGFDNWGAVGALVAGIIAKEIIVSSLAIFNGISSTSGNSEITQSLTNQNSVVHFTESSALSYLTFCLLYSPCLATMVIMKKEIGLKWTLIGAGIQLVIAYIMAFVVFNIFKLANAMGLFNVCLVVCAILLVIFSVFRVFEHLKLKNKCKNCGLCKF